MVSYLTFFSIIKKQLAYNLARQYVHLDIEDEELNEIISNSRLSERFIALARDLDVVEAKTPEDIYKSHLENTSMLILVLGEILLTFV